MKSILEKQNAVLKPNKGFLATVYRELKRNYFLYLLFVPTLLFYSIFVYWPMYGVIIAFKDFNIIDGFTLSPWVGFKHFSNFFSSIYFWRLIRNTLAINLFDICINFPAPIIFALLIHEFKEGLFKKFSQIISYLPHFISTVVIASMVVNFLQFDTGFINNILSSLGIDRQMFLSEAKYFWGIYTGMNFWKGLGWGSIIYVACMMGINTELYEACEIDGGGKWRQMWHITLPGISAAIVIQLILRVGSILSVGFESIILLYNTGLYETADVISTYVYRRGILNAEYSFSTAVGIFQSVIGLTLVVFSNWISKKYTETSLW